MVSRKRTLTAGPAERAVYELIEKGVFTPAHAALYADQIDALTELGLITARPDGSYAPAHATSQTHEAMLTLVVRIPRELMTGIDAMGRPNRSEAAREAIAEGLKLLAPPERRPSNRPRRR